MTIQKTRKEIGDKTFLLTDYEFPFYLFKKYKVKKMPVKSCNENGKPGFRWGNEGKCYTYSFGDEAGKKRAKKKAIKQGLAATGGTLTENVQEAMAVFIMKSNLGNRF